MPTSKDPEAIRDSEAKAHAALMANPFPPSPWISIGPDGIIIATGYSEALNRLLRWVPKAKWRPDKRCWLVPFSGAEAMRAVLPEITRLADATQELAEAEARHFAGEQPPFAHLTEAAERLYGSDWPQKLAEETGLGAGRVTEWRQANAESLTAHDPIFSELIRRMRKKAADLITGADRLEEWQAARRRDEGR
ncbi:hypothetical protein [Beijerinckia indica]|uniref:Uncharacterized protein n=1 Tax=Beijerinckia indica subsp. indica (strain ATCC 9039 / DSM 1715 / NCIMB 8712) TaxID=395963 RepID=B2IJ08_BEII9|nr:hypothetical protein [Beijerinckia indica]ACB94771.1 conserved hypothetical protein [Beijerinckia indica subsp. indica ATCC 9039]